MHGGSQEWYFRIIHTVIEKAIGHGVMSLLTINNELSDNEII